ncbi:hypothetical protein [Streptomyces sp. NPDC051636]
MITQTRSAGCVATAGPASAAAFRALLRELRALRPRTVKPQVAAV